MWGGIGQGARIFWSADEAKEISETVGGTMTRVTIRLKERPLTVCDARVVGVEFGEMKPPAAEPEPEPADAP